MIRVVLDSNVYISAHVFGGIPRRVLELAEAGCYRVAVSRSIRAEVEGVLVKKFGWSRERVQGACRPLWQLARSVRPQTRVVVSDDPADHHILSCALAAGAAFVVTGEDDLLRLKELQGVPILTPSQLLATGRWK
jgi:putative PIN family toxin of toxin-antitoxin system